MVKKQIKKINFDKYKSFIVKPFEEYVDSLLKRVEKTKSIEFWVEGVLRHVSIIAHNFLFYIN